ncbi:MAG: helix-turn-helix domain-containing protein [Cruoricaptor ignavus]|nr:helix-turn-helix domain-containing protein [Cruoricaptor ignavus]
MQKLCAEKPEKLTVPHRAGFFQIIWFQKGEYTHFVDFQSIEIQSNTLLFINKDMVQRFNINNNFEAKIILFTEEFFCKNEAYSKFLRKSSLFHDFFSVSQIEIQKSDTLFSELLQMMETELQREKDKIQSDILRNLLHNFLLHSERKIENTETFKINKDTDFEMVLQFNDLLDSHFREQKKVSYYAEKLFITEKKLNKVTSKILDKSPKKIIDERTMLEAKRLLAHTNDSVKEIGYFLGFDEPTNFIKFFKKHNENTPAEFREQFGMA